MIELETVEGQIIYVNPLQITTISKDERRTEFTQIRMACGTVYRITKTAQGLITEIEMMFEGYDSPTIQ